MPTTGLSMSHYDSSVEVWSAVDKVAQFSHAVGRVSGGRGSAILIALMDSQGQLIDPRANPQSSPVNGNGGTNIGNGSPHGAPPHPPIDTTGSTRFSVRSSHDSFRSISPSSVNSLEGASREGEPRRGRDIRQPPLGVLLTTSHVLCVPEEAERATVTFLDQLGLMTVASLGHDPKPIRVPLRGAYGFVTSATESNERSKRYRRGVSRDKNHCGSEHKWNSNKHYHNYTNNSSRSDSTVGRPQDSYQDEPDYLLYRYQDASDEESVDDVGFTLTFCDIFPVPAETASSAPLQPPTPLRFARPTGAVGGETSSGLPSNGTSRGVSPQISSLRSSQGRLLSSGARHSLVSHLESSNSTNEKAAAAATRARSSSSDAELTRTAASRGGGGGNCGPTASSSNNNLLLVQPLPVPLLLSAIPDVKVGDAHLMITHVNDGRRCYRVQRVAAVHSDYCEYRLANTSDDECSGGPVFSSAGDFIGIQHERNGHSICLLMKSIVRNLFESDLLGMCRSPISDASVKKRDPHTSVSDAVMAGMMVGNGMYSPKASFNRSAKSPRNNSLSETAAPTPCVGTATNGGGGNSGAFYAITAASGTAATASPADTTLALTSTTAKPLSQQVPGYEAVFNEFYSGFDSLSHILYAFPYSRQLLKLALENLSQLKYGNELDQMSTIGGVGAILDTIDGYPQDEAIVSGALAAMCRICIYERNLIMFLHLDGVTTTMEIMKEYVHHPTVLQWGTYLLVSATDASVASAAHCAEMIVQSRGPQLFVNMLRVHGAVQRKSAVRHLQCNRLIRWTCDLIANLLAPDPQCTTLFLREDFLALLLQLLHEYSGNAFLTEGFVHVFCVFVQCFSDLDTQIENIGTSDVQHPGPAGYASAFLLPRDCLVSAKLSASGVSHFARAGLVSSYATATDPHEVSFFFLCQLVASDSDNCFMRSLLDVCEAAMDTKSVLTAHRGRPEVVLLRCLTTVRLLLSWGLVRLHHRHGAGRGSGGGTSRGTLNSEDSFSCLSGAPCSTPSATFSSLLIPTPTEELVRLRAVLATVRSTIPLSYELQTQLAAVERIVQQQE